MTILGIILILAGLVVTVLRPKFNLKISRGKIRGIAGPILIALGILVLLNIIQP